MLPGVSAEDCLFSDLGLDPGPDGCQSYEATGFLLRQNRYDPTAALVLWQIGAIGVTTYSSDEDPVRRGLGVLTKALMREYPKDHRVIVYEASPYPVCSPRVDEIALEELPGTEVCGISTLYVPALGQRPSDPEIKRQLGYTE
jgi:hypothetical protein